MLPELPHPDCNTVVLNLKFLLQVLRSLQDHPQMMMDAFWPFCNGSQAAPWATSDVQCKQLLC